MQRFFIVITVLIFCSAVLLIYTRHLSRLVYVEISELQNQRDELNIEWNVILTEKSVWDLYRIEKAAKDILGLVEPSTEDIEYIWLDKK